MVYWLIEVLLYRRYDQLKILISQQFLDRVLETQLVELERAPKKRLTLLR